MKIQKICSHIKEEFCFVCGFNMGWKKMQPITSEIKCLYEKYYNHQLVVTSYSPSSCCKSCYTEMSEYKEANFRSATTHTPIKWLPEEVFFIECHVCRFVIQYSPMKRSSSVYIRDEIEGFQESSEEEYSMSSFGTSFETSSDEESFDNLYDTVYSEKPRDRKLSKLWKRIVKFIKKK